MSDVSLSRVRQNCCRLCLAPDTECISIFNSYAADKEPLITKIQSCVSIKVTPNDRLSLSICHACISYLNSWQSFKNRCLTSQKTQRSWLDNNLSIITTNATDNQSQLDEYQEHNPSLASSILDGITTLKKRKSLTVYVSPKKRKQQQQQQLQLQQLQLQQTQQQHKQHKQQKYFKHLTQQPIKPFATHAAQVLKQQQLLQKSQQQFKEKAKRRKQPTMLLPKLQQLPALSQLSQLASPLPQQQTETVAATNFSNAAQQLRLFRRYSYNPLPAVQIKEEPTDNEDDYSMKQHDESDDIVDPTMFLERTQEVQEGTIIEPPNYTFPMERPSSTPEVKEASCRACNLKFSTRANARRHERNLHPNLFEFTSSTTNNTPVTRPTSALAAALELRRVSHTPNAVDISQPSISQQKYRQLVVNAFNQSEAGGYDYDNPEKYQNLLTDEKIVFLQQNEDFLSQYQNMTCRCCNKNYTTYKNFMAHMRKKYATLPRNLCFNCLKLNDSKAHFISHLKRRNCINLYKVLHALMSKNSSFAAAVRATSAAVPEKLRAKELLVNKMYECKLCPKSFRLKLEFRSHVSDDHADAQKKDTGSKQCSFCALELEDAAERKRHSNNMDCIVSLRCVTCNAKFDKHQQFLDHVYEQHLAGFGDQTPIQQSSFTGRENASSKRSIGGTSSDETRSSQPKAQYFSRMPQACAICGQQYNNYNNVLRHMESKHPDQLPQTYKCVKCGTGFPRLSNLREHMINTHAAESIKHTGFEYIVNADAVKISGGNNNSNVYTGRYDYVMKDLMSITNGGTTDDAENEQAVKKIRLDTSTNNSKNNGTPDGKVYSSSKECPICNAVFSNNIGLSNHMRSHTAAAQNAAAAAISAAKSANSALNISASKAKAAATVPPQGTREQVIFRRSLEQAADRRFRRMRCRICQRRFSSKKSYRFHMLNDHQIRNVQFIKCKICDAEFAYEKGLKVHMFKIHNTLLRDEMIIKQYECDICSIVYRTEDQLLQHKRTVHGNENAHVADFAGNGSTAVDAVDHSGVSTPVSGISTAGTERNSVDHTAAPPLYWYQCKYCPSNFNTNKKLAIHINSHDEFDSNDYSCKDCGNVYSGRKSLWVHRYKKHPQIAEPSECTLCKKVFFDSQMLENHIPTCNRIQITNTLDSSNPPIYKHKTGDDEDISHDAMDMSDIGTGTLGAADVEISSLPTAKIKFPEIACTICGRRFTDQDLFTKHIQMHERELYTDNPLAAMFDTGPADPNQFYLDRVNDNGEYACDLCSKTFPQMTALKVHRKWHFRGDSKQNQAEVDVNSSQTQTNHPHLLGLQAVGLMPNPRPSSRSLKHKRELKCEYCASTFISNNNLRRHIYELHKDEIGNLPQPPKIETDKYLCCGRCDIKFSNKSDWIEHKVGEARVMKPYGPFQWGCDLCGAYVSRKEKLINHISNHIKENVIVPVDQLEQEGKSEKHKEINDVKNKVGASENVKRAEKRKYEVDEEHEEVEEKAEESEEEDEAEEDVAEDDDEEEEDEEDMVEYVGEEQDGEAEQEDEEVEQEDEEGDSDEEANESTEEGDAEDEDGSAQEEDAEDIYENDVVEEHDNSDVDDVEMDEDTNDNEQNAMLNHLTPKLIIKTKRNSADTTEAEDSPSYIGEDDEDDGDGDDTDSDDSNSSMDERNSNKSKSNSCDLCQVYFDSQQELQKHVKTHFLNGPGAVTLGDVKRSTVNKSRSSSNDVYAVSS